MVTHKKYTTTTTYSGEIIFSGKWFDTYEEAKANTNSTFTEVDWEEYNKDGFCINSSYSDNPCPWI